MMFPKIMKSPALIKYFFTLLLLIPLHLSAQVKFIPNEGQFRDDFNFYGDIPGGRVFLSRGEIAYSFLNSGQLREFHDRKYLDKPLEGHAVKLKFLNCNDDHLFSSAEPSEEYYNFFLGRDPAYWKSGIHAAGNVKLKDLYPGITLEIYGFSNGLKYNFYVEPGAKPDNISMAFEGQEDIFVDSGELYIRTSVNSWKELRPYAYQIIEGQKIEVPCHFHLNENRVSFHFPEKYSKKHELVIDPEVVFSTYSGSTSDNFGYTATFDRYGNGYSGGTVFGPNYPVTTGAFQVKWGGGKNIMIETGDIPRDVGILKYNDSGTAAIYVTYLGGTGNEDPHSMIVDQNGDLLVFGNTNSTNFPMGLGTSYDTSYNGDYDIYVAKISSDGKKLINATYVGGSGEDGLNGRYQGGAVNAYVNKSPLGYNYGDVYRGEVIIDSANNVLVVTTTKSTDFPAGTNAFQSVYGGGYQDGCILKLNSSLSTLNEASFIGGNKDDASYGVVIDPLTSDLYIAGGTLSDTFDYSITGYQKSFQGGKGDGFIIKVDKDLKTLKSSTYFGTQSYDQTYFVQVDKSGNGVYVTGQTKNNNFPVKNVKYSNSQGKQFISKFNNTLDTLIFSSTFGSGATGNPDLSPSAFLVDTCGRIYFSGWGGQTNFQRYIGPMDITSDAYQATSVDKSDFYLAVFSPGMDDLIYSTYYGGPISSEHVDGGTSRFDKNGVVYQSICAGCWGNSDLPTTPNAFSRVNGDGDGCNNALIKIDLNKELIIADFQIPPAVCVDDTVPFTNTSTAAIQYFWFFGDGTTSQDKDPVHKYPGVGIYKVKLIVVNPITCKISDTLVKEIKIYGKSKAEIKFDTGACVNAVDFHSTGDPAWKHYWEFGDGKFGAGKDLSHSYADTGTYQVVLVTDSGTTCADTATTPVKLTRIITGDFSFFILDSCKAEVSFFVTSKYVDSFLWIFGDGDTSTQKNPIHYFKRSDSLLVKLVLEPGEICSDTVEKWIYLEAPQAIPSFTFIDSCGFKVNFFDNSQYSDNTFWDFGINNDTSHRKNPVYTFPGPGTYSVFIRTRSTKYQNCIDSGYFPVKVDPLPEAGFRFERASCSPFLNIVDTSRFTKNVRWDIASLNIDTVLPAGDTLKLRLENNDPFLVKQWASPNSICEDYVSIPYAPGEFAYADFTVVIEPCTTTVKFSNNSTFGSYGWDFGNGTQSTTKQKSFIRDYDTSGSFQVTLVVSAGGCSDTQVVPVLISPVPKVAFTMDSFSCSPEIVFSNGSSNYTDLVWDFGDGDSSLEKNPVHVFPRKGNYDVILKLNPGGSCEKKLKKRVVIDSFAYSGFKAERDSCEFLTRFSIPTDSAGDYQWDFGDGNTSDRFRPSHTYDTAGTYQVSLIATNEGCTDTFTLPVEIEVPFAEFLPERDTCSREVKFDNKSRSASNYQWDFGNGRLSKAGSPIEKYDKKGNYRVVLIANPYSICADTVEKVVNVGPFVEVDFNVDPVFCRNMVRLKNTSVGADRYLWDFGDGETDTARSPEHTYREEDSFDIILIAGNESCSDTVTKTFITPPLPVAGFTMDKRVCLPIVDFYDSSILANSYSWAFGDGGEGDEKNPTHGYSSPGQYIITLVINENTPCEDRFTDTVEIKSLGSGEVKIPNVFTPNGDGKNDFFEVEFDLQCSPFEIEIYNRWGQLVYKNEGGPIRWNGRVNGRPSPSGTYYYSFKSDVLTQTGTVSIVK